MPTYPYETRTKLLDTATVATLEDALFEVDIPQAYRNALLCQMFMGRAREPGLTIQGQDLMLPKGPRPERKTMGGTRAEVFVNFEVGVNAQSFRGNQVLNTSQTDGPTVAFTDWAYYTTYFSIAGTDRVENTGRSKRLDLVRSLQNQEIRQLTRTMETDLWGTNSDIAKGTQDDFTGVQHLFQDDPTAASTVLGLPQGTFTPWRNATSTSLGSFASGGLDAMRSMVFTLAGTNGHEKPHLITTTTTVGGFAVKALEGIHRLVGNLDGSDLSSRSLPTFMGIPMVTTDDQASGTMVMWNFDYLCCLVHEGADWTDIIPGEPNDQWLEDQKRWVFGAAPLMVTRREKFGQIDGITA